MAWCFYVLIALAVLYLVLSVIVASVCLGMLCTTKQRHTFEYARSFDTDNGFGESFKAYDSWDKTDFELQSDDVLLKGTYIVNPNDKGKRKKVAVICHGHTMNRLAAVKYAKTFYECGFSIMTYDARYFGESGGEICTLGLHERRDLANITRFTRTVFGEDCIIGYHGESMGAATVLLALDYEKPDFVIADCPFSDTMALLRYLVGKVAHFPWIPTLAFARLMAINRYDYDFKKVSPIESVKKSEVPICFIHGLNDTFIPCEHSRKMFAVCRNEKSELHLFEGAEHAYSNKTDPARYDETVREFIKKCGF